MFRIGAWNSEWTRENYPVAAPRGDSPNHPPHGGYGAIFARHATQANEGCDFDFLAQGPSRPRTQDPLTLNASRGGLSIPRLPGYRATVLEEAARGAAVW